MAPRRIHQAEGLAAVAVCRDLGLAAVPRSALGTAVRFTLQQLASASPGRSVEVRVPPFAAIQCLPGPAHRRGTPPSVVETDPVTWLSVALGIQSWADAVASGAVLASGRRADLGELLPLRLPEAP